MRAAVAPGGGVWSEGRGSAIGSLTRLCVSICALDAAITTAFAQIVVVLSKTRAVVKVLLIN
jgi:hypothetical protein